MITGVFLRHYKNYGNLNFIPICDDSDNMFSIYIGNNGVGKSAILESIDVFFNNREWNFTIGMKKSEAFVCPLFLISKSEVTSSCKKNIEIVSNYFWGEQCEINVHTRTNKALIEFIEYRNRLKHRYENTHYLIMIGVSYNSGREAFFGSSFNNDVLELLGSVHEDAQKAANQIRDIIIEKYSYIYIPVEASPSELLKLQNNTMQKLLNKDVLQEIERILKKKEDGKTDSTIVSRINRNLDTFIKEVNSVISSIDVNYSFAPSIESGNKKSLTAKDIRDKIIEAYFPLRSLKVRNKRVESLSSGEQRRAVIDVAYSTLLANKNRKTEKKIILAVDEPESSMHISNCFNQFLRLEELTQGEIHKQVLITTHWYGFLPITQHGNMHHLMLDSESDQTKVRSFNLRNVLENRRYFPDDVELKSLFDLASSLITYMRYNPENKWIICEGSDDVLYLRSMLEKYDSINILPVGGCGNVVKLFQMLFGFVTENTGTEDINAKALFLIDTDGKQIKVAEPFKFGQDKRIIILRRLQIDNGEIKLINPMSYDIYNQTEMEDCLDPQLYYQALSTVIKESKNTKAKLALKKMEFLSDAKTSMLRGDDSCICPKDIKNLKDKKIIIEFAEDSDNKYRIASKYAELNEGNKVQHALAKRIIEILNLDGGSEEND